MVVFPVPNQLSPCHQVTLLFTVQLLRIIYLQDLKNLADHNRGRSVTVRFCCVVDTLSGRRVDVRALSPLAGLASPRGVCCGLFIKDSGVINCPLNADQIMIARGFNFLNMQGVECIYEYACGINKAWQTSRLCKHPAAPVWGQKVSHPFTKSLDVQTFWKSNWKLSTNLHLMTRWPSDLVPPAHWLLG